MTPTKKPAADAAEEPKKSSSAKATEDKPAKKPAAHKAAAPKKAATPKKAVAHAEAPAAASEEAKEEAAAPAKRLPSGSYIYAIGRRKSATAQTRLYTNGKGEISVNGKPYAKYFTVFDLQEAVTAPLKAIGMADADVTLKVVGGGMRGQAEASRLGISRALIELNPMYRKTLKKMGFLMRDPREKERKKYGLKKARKAPQWAKR
ncbi:MAG: hypothetical protein RL272_299 [Candidatus Parcubacteria bacterium]|jgi:small subunit ribosomal protein S9